MVCAPHLPQCRPLVTPGLGRWGSGLTLAMLLLSSLSSPAALAQNADPAVLPTAAPTVSGGRIVRPTLRLGSQGESVRELQSMLILLGFYPGPVSGLYQEDTQAAVQRFQRAAAITADGIVGPATWSQLFPAPAAEASPPNSASPAAAASTTPATNAPPAATTATPPASGTASPPATSTPSRPPATTSPASPASPTSPATPPNTASLPILRPGMEGDAVRLLQRRLAAKDFYRGPISGVFGSQTEEAVRQFQRSSNLAVDGIVGPATWGALN